MKHKPIFLSVLLSSLLLAGCGGSTESSTQSSSPVDSSSTSSSSSSSQTEYDTHTIAELIELCQNYTESASPERYYVRGTVESIENPQYGSMILSDETGEIEVYGTYSADGTIRYNQLEDKPVAGDEVLLYANIQLFKGTPEIYSGWIIEFTHVETPIDPDEYELSTLKEAHDAEKGEVLKVEGTVLSHTYNASLSEIGFMLGDETGTMYIYDNQIAPQVEVGEEVVLVGTKDYWILEDEQEVADKNGYLGGNQLTDITLVSHVAGGSFDYEAVAKETTVKALLETDFSEDITGTLYKVPAYIKQNITYTSTGEVDFINYYIDDLDGTTGTYAYSQAGGKDFAWLEKYDEQVVYLYMTILNARMTSSNTNWRILPISVSEEPFDASSINVPEFALTYYANEQFAEQYVADPSLEVVTSVTNDIIPFNEVTFTYESSDTARLSFAQEEGKMVMHVYPEDIDNVTITIHATYGEETASSQVTVQVIDLEAMPAMSVSEAIAAPVDEANTIYVRGTVGPSLVNQPGFYLIDETGTIAVRFPSEGSFDPTIQIGHEVIVEGYRYLYGGNNSQVCINDASIFGNLYGGDGTYPTDSFITDKTVTDFLTGDVYDPARSTQVYVFTDVSITVYTGGYTPQYEIIDAEGNYIMLYGSGASQHAWLDPFLDQKVTVEVAPCKWNNNKSYTGHILSVTGADGVKVYNTLNF